MLPFSLHYWIWPLWPTPGFHAHLEELFSLFVSLTCNWPQLFFAMATSCLHFLSLFPKQPCLSSCFFFSLQSFNVDSATAVIQDGSVSLKVDTQHLRDISFRTNSTYQFIGELQLREDNDVHDPPYSSSFFSACLILAEITTLHQSLFWFAGDSTSAHWKERRWPRPEPLPAVSAHPTATRSEAAELQDEESMICCA